MGWVTRAGLAIVASLVACNGDSKDDGTIDTIVPDLGTPFEQIGGEEALHDVVDAFISQVGADASINWMFANSDLAALNSSVYDLACESLGGGCTYSGRSMLEAHAGMGITESQWGSFFEDLYQAVLAVENAYIVDKSREAGLLLDPSSQFDGSRPMDQLFIAFTLLHDDVVEDPEGKVTYFNQLGGFFGIRGVVDDMVANIGADARINGYFAETDLVRLSELLTEQICDAVGGYCVYSGRSMVAAHAGLCISDADFDALVEDLLLAMNSAARYDPVTDPESKAPYSPALDGSRLFDNLLVALSGMRSDIVETCAL